MFTPLHVCMDSSTDWLQGAFTDDASALMDSSSPPSGDMLTCSRPLMERRLKPQHDQPLKCPRCDSAHTKFCYYNNYSLSQPRYFCKTCRRYWTKGGNLRNIPVGGGCRKNKKVSSSSSSSSSAGNSNNVKSKLPALTGSGLHINQQGISPLSLTDLHLSLSPEIQLSQLNTMINSGTANGAIHSAFGDPAMNFGFIESKYNPMIDMGNSENPPAVSMDFMVGGDHLSPHTNNQIYQLGLVGDVMGVNPSGFHGICSPFGIMSLEGHSNNGGNQSSLLAENFQKLMLPHNQGLGLGNDQEDHQNQTRALDVKPNSRMLSLEWQQDQNCSANVEKNASIGYFNGLGSAWSGGMMMNDYKSSASTNPLV